MQLIDCNPLPVEITRTYGGLTGPKISVRYNDEVYMLKSQQRLKDKNFKNIELSYANDPITEYIGSHIYALLRYPVHDTLLGTYNNKLCVLCKDLAYPDSIIEFKSLRNTLMDEKVIQHSSGMSTSLDDIMQVIDLYPAIDKEQCLYHFWTMFAVDSVIGNTDRNNGNWGFLKYENSLVRCPVYDCGGCLNNKRSDEQMKTDIQSGSIKNIALNYTLSFKHNGRRVNPFHYMQKHMNVYLQFGVNLTSSLQMSKVIALIDSLGDILSPIKRLYYVTLIDYRVSELRKYGK